jgi:hypothetical protein
LTATLTATRKTWIAVGGLLLACAAGAWLAAHWFRAARQSQLFLQTVPAKASGLVYVDVAALRSSPFLNEIYRWAPHPDRDSDYKNFVQSTGFDYERDLDAVLIFSLASSKPNSSESSATPKANSSKPRPNTAPKANAADDATPPQARGLLAIAEGRWDANRIAAYARQNGTSQSVGGHEVVRVSLKDPVSTMYFAILGKGRLALSSDLGVLSDLLAGRLENPEQADWNARIRRVAGSPVFAVLRQDASAAEALAERAPGGFTSPQLSSLLEQLQWITVAAKPEAQQLQLVAEGETLSESTTLQLSDVLKGIVVLAETGLNDPKLRQQLDPALRAAYLELLQSADVTRLDRGQSKSIRLSLTITPKFLEAAKKAAPALSSPTEPGAAAPAKAHPKAGT